MDDSVRTSSVEQRLTASSNVSQIASLRRRVADFARDRGAPEQVVVDLELAVSELATNVAQHADTDQIRVVVRYGDDRWTIEVDDAGGLDTLSDTTLPAPDALSGRGLFIVQSVMDEVELVDDGGHRRLRCSKLVS
jgi:serine/threonine-protein kinase RsbW